MTGIGIFFLFIAFRACPYSLLTSVDASLDVNESDVMFHVDVKERKNNGRLHSVGFKRLILDYPLALETVVEAASDPDLTEQVTILYIVLEYGVKFVQNALLFLIRPVL